MIPRTVEDVLDKTFEMSPSMDNTELEAWLALLPNAVHRAYEMYAEKKFAAETAATNVPITKAREFEMMDGDYPNVTAKKIALEGRQALIDATNASHAAERDRRLTDALVEMIKERSAAIRKIATIRANTIQYSENNYNAKRYSQVVQAPEHPPEQPSEPVQQTPAFVPQQQGSIQQAGQNSQTYTPPPNAFPQQPAPQGQQAFFPPQQ